MLNQPSLRLLISLKSKTFILIILVFDKINISWITLNTQWVMRGDPSGDFLHFF